MKTLVNPRRAMRPHPAADHLPERCAWCSKAIPRGVVFTRGTNLGKDAIVCPDCVTPPAIGTYPNEITVED